MRMVKLMTCEAICSKGICAAVLAARSNARDCWRCVRDFAPGTSSGVRSQAQAALEDLAEVLDFQTRGLIILRRLLANGLAGQYYSGAFLCASQLGLFPMRLHPMHLIIVAGVLINSVVMSSVVASNAPIYKCKDAHGGVLYTDTPCKGGEQLNLKPGIADPAAILRLERAQATLDELAAKRRADEALEEFKKEAERLTHEQPEAQDPVADGSDAKTVDPEQFVGVFTGTFENGVPVYRGFPPITVIASRKVELAKIAREQALAREAQIRTQVASKHREQESVKATSVPHAPQTGSGAGKVARPATEAQALGSRSRTA
jgi:hypothetical protein